MSLESKSPLKKKVSKKAKIVEYKKTVLGGGFVVVIAIAGIFIGINIFDLEEEESIFTIGTIELKIER